LFGYDGTDTIYGGAGNDTIDGGADSDYLMGGTLFLTPNETGTGDDTINGGAGDDLIYGQDGNDTLSGDDGKDAVYGGAGVNTLAGGAGNDTLYSASAGDVLDGGSTGETVNNGDIAALDRSTTSAALTLSLDAGAGGATITLADGTQLSNIERLEFTGGSGDDTVSGLTSGQYADVLQGGGGVDRLQGGGGADQIYGGAGNDIADGGADGDQLYGGNTTSQTETGTGDDELRGGDGNDDIRGQDGNDRLFGDAGTDTIYGGAGNDTIDGGADSDYLMGGTLFLTPNETGTGDDTINGGAGNDIIYGQDGNDTLTGGTGSDNLDGGAGTDVALFSGPETSYTVTLLADGSTRVVDNRVGSPDGTDILRNIEELRFDAVNSIPTITSPTSFSVAENTTTVGTITATDADIPAQTLTYSIAGGADAARFTIDANTGALSFINAPDFEVPGDVGANNVYNVTVRVTDSLAASSQADLAITVTNVVEANEPIGPVSDANASINNVAENATAGTLVGITASATDPDAGDTVTYSLSDNAGGRFVIDATTGVVAVAAGAPLDAEAAGAHNLTVVATSSDGTTASQSFAVGVTDVDEFDVSAVTDADASTNTVAENSAVGTTVGLTARATDADATTNVVTYAFSSTGNPGGLFAINASTGVVTVAGALDYEAATSHTIEVVATSADGSSSTQSFTIAIGDVNENTGGVGPVSDVNGAANAVFENAVAGTPVGITARATDPDAGDTVSYFLSNDANGRFTIDASTGVVTTVSQPPIDAETSAPSYFITAVAQSSDGSSTSSNFTIFVNDVDEFDVSPVTDVNPAANVVAENAAAGTAVGVTAFAVDGDVTLRNVSYAFTADGNPGGQFAINAQTGVVTVAAGAVLDAETAGSHVVTVVATSLDGSTSTQSFTITVNDVDEFDISPLTDADASTDTVAENAAAGTVVGVTARATDADATNNGVTYAFSATGNPGSLFAIDANTGVVTVAGALDYESETSHTIEVVATSADGSTSTRSFTIAVSDVNENSGGVGPVADTNAAADAVAENAAAGTVVGITARASDPDAADTVSYALSNNAGGRFVIDAATGIVTVAAGAALDAEAAASHDITVVATSSDGSSAQRNFTIGVSDVDEFDVSAVTDVDATNDPVAENAAVGTAVGITARATDADATTNTVTYAFTSGGNPGNLFAIDAATGIVTLAGALDYETATSHTVEVVATSADGSSRNQTFTVAVGDVNEGGNAAPVITSNGGGATAAIAIAEGAAAVTDVDANDADIGQALTYAIVGGADAAQFTIDPATGALRFVTAPDYEAPADAGGNNVYDVQVGVSDGAGGSDTQSIAVTVTNVVGVNIVGTNGRDVLNGTAEDDRLVGQGGSDNLNGQGGNDSLYGGLGDDIVNGGDGNDLLEGGRGRDQLNGGNGIDTASYASSRDGVNVNLQAGTASGSDASGDRLTSIENLVGSAWADTLTGNSGANDLSGGGGNDVLRGLGGADRLWGGSGNDTFDFDALADSGLGAAADTLLDFARGSDRIDLSTIDADSGSGGNQAFASTLLQGRDTAFTGAGQLRTWYDAVNNQTIVQGNTDGDADAEFEIHLAGNVDLSATDFAL
jgi:Ca2+-binding RTX toxin-like protein